MPSCRTAPSVGRYRPSSRWPSGGQRDAVDDERGQRRVPEAQVLGLDRAGQHGRRPYVLARLLARRVEHVVQPLDVAGQHLYGQAGRDQRGERAEEADGERVDRERGAERDGAVEHLEAGEREHHQR
jgi:hypothetical protein